MSLLISRCILLIGFTAWGIAAQSMGSRLPLSGFVYDGNSRSLRPLLGVPGSAYAGAAVVEDLDHAWASGRGAAIGVRGEEVIVFTALETLGRLEHRDSQLIMPTKAVWSSDGARALLYSPAVNMLQRVTVSPGVMVEPSVQVAFLGEEVKALAISDSGQIAFAAGASLYLLHDSAPQEIASELTGPVALTFADDHKLYAAVGSSVLQFQIDSASGVTTRQVMEGRSFSDLAVNRKTGQLFGVDAAASQVVVYGLATGTVQEILLERTPSTLQLLKPDSILLLNGIESQGSPVIVLEIANEPTVMFIPVANGDRQ